MRTRSSRKRRGESEFTLEIRVIGAAGAIEVTAGYLSAREGEGSSYIVLQTGKSAEEKKKKKKKTKKKNKKRGTSLLRVIDF